MDRPNFQRRAECTTHDRYKLQITISTSLFSNYNLISSNYYFKQQFANCKLQFDNSQLQSNPPPVIGVGGRGVTPLRGLHPGLHPRPAPWRAPLACLHKPWYIWVILGWKCQMDFKIVKIPGGL